MRRAMLTAKPSAPRAWMFTNDIQPPVLAGNGYTYGNLFQYQGAGGIRTTSLSMYVGTVNVGTGTMVLSVWDTTNASRVASVSVHTSQLLANTRNVFTPTTLLGDLVRLRSYIFSAYAPTGCNFTYKLATQPAPATGFAVGTGYYYASGDVYPGSHFTDNSYMGLLNMEYEVV